MGFKDRTYLCFIVLILFSVFVISAGNLQKISRNNMVKWAWSRYSFVLIIH